MKIVKAIGGLGNQMFQYALYEALRKRHSKERVLLDLSCFRGYRRHQGFEISRVFGASYEEASWREVARLAYPYPGYQWWRIGSRILPARKTMLRERADFAFEQTALTRTTSTYYDGYWQHEEYFGDIRKELLATFRFPELKDERNRLTAQRIANSTALSVHVRRGDYTTNSLYKNICNELYYRRALAMMMGECRPDLICIFSDDIAWCRDTLEGMMGRTEHLYVDWNRDADYYIDMQLMTLCRHHIIANSSFSWWGAWLSQAQDKRVCAPRRWMNNKEIHSPVLKDWIST